MNRVVTGYDESGVPAIISQGEPPTVIHAGRYVTTELWVTDRTPPEAVGSDMSARAWTLEPPTGGTCFRIVEIAPGGDEDDDGGAGDGGAADDSGAVPDAETAGFQDAHATGTLDYVTVLSGQVTLVVGGTEVTLGPGDSVVQQPGVPHDWQNRSADRAVMVGVLISAH
jgi:mannose-6-phosphate isomerase-like protein (cupin superfamily)